MNRISNFEALKSHPWHKRLFARLKKPDIDFCLEWIKANNHLDKDTFEMRVNRMFLDAGATLSSKTEKAKRMICQELIASSNG